MSRSYKKYPGVKDCNSWMKNYANRRLRQISPYEEIGDGNWYRRYTCPYEISDYDFHEYDVRTFEEYRIRRTIFETNYGFVFLSRMLNRSRTSQKTFDENLKKEWNKDITK